MDLSPLEQAVAIKRMRETQNLTQEQAAERLAKGVSWIKHSESLLRLPDDVMDSLQSGHINPSVALELGRIEDDHVRKYYLQSAVDYGATRNVASTWVRNYLSDGSSPDPKEMSEISENVRKASSGHKLPCHVCERSFPLSQLSNFFACHSCIEAIAGATRHVPEN
ncbi:Nucleoid occlusion protein [subsurface metagenome]